MKKLSLAFITMLMFLCVSMPQVQAEKIDYEKYGRIAIAVVRADYPGDPVTEYKFIGRDKISESDVQDSFQFQVKENGKPITILVKVRHSVQNNKLLTLTVEEVKQ